MVLWDCKPRQSMAASRARTAKHSMERYKDYGPYTHMEYSRIAKHRLLRMLHRKGCCPLHISKAETMHQLTICTTYTLWNCGLTARSGSTPLLP